jgi:hypothetical protein
MRLMRRATVFWALYGCTYLDITVPPPPPPPVCPPAEDPTPEAHVIHAIRMSRRQVGFAPYVDALHAKVVSGISAVGVRVSHTLAVPLAETEELTAPFFFDSCTQPSEVSLSETVRLHAAPMSTSQRQDACELLPLAAAGKSFRTLAAPGSRTPFFDRKASYVFVVLIDPQAREHAYSACDIEGVSLADYFWGSPWIDTIDRSRVFFLTFATSENGEGVAAFEQECLEEPDFPSAALDSMTPSKEIFFTRFNEAIPEAQRLSVEMCEALSSDGDDIIAAKVKRMIQPLGF